jgi:hypothetical protein
LKRGEDFVVSSGGLANSSVYEDEVHSGSHIYKGFNMSGLKILDSLNFVLIHGHLLMAAGLLFLLVLMAVTRQWMEI